MIQKNFRLSRQHAEWLKNEAVKTNLTETEIIRRLLDEAVGIENQPQISGTTSSFDTSVFAKKEDLKKFATNERVDMLFQQDSATDFSDDIFELRKAVKSLQEWRKKVENR